MKAVATLVLVGLMYPAVVMAGDYDHCRGVEGEVGDTRVVRPSAEQVAAAADYKQLSDMAMAASPANALAVNAVKKQAACAEKTFIALHPNYFQEDKKPKRKVFRFLSWPKKPKTLSQAQQKPPESQKKP